MAKGLTPQGDSYAQWYQDLVREAGLAENSAVPGCMVIKPYGFAIWENMKAVLDARFKATGHVNAAFPLLIPKSFLSKEAAHVDGFAKECAVVTHYRLKNDPDGQGVIVDPDAKLSEELIVRPTSETIIWDTYKNWIQSYRDLPLLINQWANVLRWEMRTRLFLRTAEFFWQEGHTAHATKQEAMDEATMMLEEYASFMENYLAIPVVRGVKSETERFAGADETYTVEGLMKDGKALQMGTSHFLGQNFAKAFDVKFQTKDGGLEYVWATSWCVSTRMMGALILAHSDDNGLVVPPKIAPIQVVAVPIINKKTQDRQKEIDQAIEAIQQELGSDVRFKYDDDDNKRAGFKFAEYEMKGVPVRIALGARDLDKQTIEIARRDTGEKNLVALDDAASYIRQLLIDIQDAIYNKALSFRKSNTHIAHTKEEFMQILEAHSNNSNGKKPGFIATGWDGTAETEAKVKALTKATLRCMPLQALVEETVATDPFSGEPAKAQVIYAIAY